MGNKNSQKCKNDMNDPVYHEAPYSSADCRWLNEVPYEPDSPIWLNRNEQEPIWLKRDDSQDRLRTDLVLREYIEEVYKNNVYMIRSGEWKETALDAETSHFYNAIDESNKEEKAIVRYSYLAVRDDELTLHKGDVITLVEQDVGMLWKNRGWWKGILNGKTGVFPSNFVEMIKIPVDDDASSKDEDTHHEAESFVRTEQLLQYDDYFGGDDTRSNNSRIRSEQNEEIINETVLQSNSPNSLQSGHLDDVINENSTIAEISTKNINNLKKVSETSAVTETHSFTLIKSDVSQHQTIVSIRRKLSDMNNGHLVHWKPGGNEGSFNTAALNTRPKLPLPLPMSRKTLKPPPIPPHGEKPHRPPEATYKEPTMDLYGEKRANVLGLKTSTEMLYDDEIYESPELKPPPIPPRGEKPHRPPEDDQVSLNEQYTPRTPAIEDRLELFQETIINKMMIRQVLPHLHSIINPADVETIRKTSETKTYQTAAKLALYHLSKSDKPDKWQLFLKGLEASGHITLTQLLKGEDVDLEDDNNYYGFIRLFSPTIRTVIRPLDLLPHLIASDVITQEDADEIRTKQNIKGDTAASDLLLDRVHRKHPDWYNEFMNACEKSNLSELVDICRTESKNYAVNEATRTVKQEKHTCTKHKVPRPTKKSKADQTPHIRFDKSSQLTQCFSANSKSALTRINVTEDEDIFLENTAKHLQDDNNYLKERIKKVHELTKTCDRNRELVSEYKLALETLKNKQETIKKIHTEIAFTFEVTSTKRSSGSIVSAANDHGFYET